MIIRLVTREENDWLNEIRQLKALYPKDPLLIYNPNAYSGYNLINGKKISLKYVEEEKWAKKDKNTQHIEAMNF